jgi:aspartate aminotransferase-like enzyme
VSIIVTRIVKESVVERYEIPLMPGPVSIPPDVLSAYAVDYGSADTEVEFFHLYEECERGLQELLRTRNSIAILSGEGMIALWGALKSVVQPGDRVLAVATGVFGFGIGEMAEQIGAHVDVVGSGYDEVLDAPRVREAAHRIRPKLITAVHCETPSGTLNPIAELGEIAREVDALLYVDFVASAGGAPLRVDEWGIDLGLLGSQKVLSCMSDLAMVSISESAWTAIDHTSYVGYDALAPWRTAVADRYLPYTHNWHALAGLRIVIDRIVHDEGVDASIRRHQEVGRFCVERLEAMGVEIWPVSASYSSPTVTAAKVPDGWTWEALDARLREHGMVVGGSYGPLAGKVFRIGHMGTQADRVLVGRGMDVLAEVICG